MEQSVISYMAEVGRYPLLSREEETEAFRDLEAGKRGARDRIAQSNLRFVVKIALGFQGRGLPLSDLIQEGNIGLLEVIDRFDYHRGFRFSTYAAFWIRQAIQHAIRSKVALVHIPTRKARRMDRIHGSIEEMKVSSGRRPDASDVAEVLDLSEAQVEELLDLRESIVALDAPIDESGMSVMQFMSDPATPDVAERILDQEARRHVAGALGVLTSRERRVVQLRYGLEDGVERSLREVSRIVDLSQEGVRRIERRAFDKLRRSEATEPLTQCA